MLKYLKVAGHGSAPYSQLVQQKKKNSLCMREEGGKGGMEGEHTNVAKY